MEGAWCGRYALSGSHMRHTSSYEHGQTKAIEERTSERNMNVTLRCTLMVCVLALVLAAMWAGTASAAPQGSVDPTTLSPPPPPGAQCNDTGNYVICQTF